MIEFIKVTSPEEYQECLAIREIVFTNEQGVPPDQEVDTLDEVCTHFLLYVDMKPVGTARIYPVSQTSCKIQRVAILKEHRGKGLGNKIIKNLLTYAKDNNFHEISLSSQISALKFYEKLGFTAYEDVFMDAGIPHKAMKYNHKCL